MAINFQSRMNALSDTSTDIDAGLRAYMLRIYNYMTVGLALTGVVAYLTASTPALFYAIYGTPLKWVVMFAPLIMVFFIMPRFNRMSASAAQLTYWIFAGIMGLSMSIIFLAYTGASIAEVFFITAGMFASLSLYGYTTKRSLASWRSFLFMGLIGIILAMAVNIFLASEMMGFVISVLGVLVFAGLTAYDTQVIKEMYYEGDGTEVMTKKSIMGALRLYLDFLNMFLFLLAIFGRR